MCIHNWKEYKDKETNKYYRICTKCGIAQEYQHDIFSGNYVTNKSLCRTNNWIDRETWRLRYGN